MQICVERFVYHVFLSFHLLLLFLSLLARLDIVVVERLSSLPFTHTRSIFMFLFSFLRLEPNDYENTDASGFKNYDPKLGLNYLEFRKTFLDKDTAGLLETDLNHDYKAFVSFVRGGRDEKESDKKGTNSTSFDDK